LSRALALALASLLTLGACTHARVVQRVPDGRAAPSRTEARPSISPLPADGLHVVRPGETLYGISFRFGLRYQDVAAWNGVPDPYLIEVGQRLRLSPPRRGELPPPRVAVAPARAPSPPRNSAIAPATATVLPPGTPPRNAALPAATTRPAPVSVAPRVPPTVAPPPTWGAAPPWRWPAQGQIVGNYVAGDQTRQGIDIAGSAGQDVLAAADGVVVYSGAGLVGYGELIIVKHSDEWLSAYAHNQKRLVSEGTRVSAGQVIARMGHTGAARNMLHFEIRRNGKPVDPLAQLPKH
jgi:lipoprotein NlpD